jgi:hypothetical protein
MCKKCHYVNKKKDGFKFVTKTSWANCRDIMELLSNVSENIRASRAGVSLRNDVSQLHSDSVGCLRSLDCIQSVTALNVKYIQNLLMFRFNFL